MEIVIDIDEALYEYMQSRYKYQNKGDEGLSTAEEAGVAIKNGTPLPKGHGRLIDVNDLLNRIGLEDNDANFGRYVREVNKIIKEVEEKIEREGADTTNGGIIDPENEYLWKEYMK